MALFGSSNSFTGDTDVGALPEASRPGDCASQDARGQLSHCINDHWSIGFLCSMKVSSRSVKKRRTCFRHGSDTPVGSGISSCRNSFRMEINGCWNASRISPITELHIWKVRMNSVKPAIELAKL